MADVNKSALVVFEGEDRNLSKTIRDLKGDFQDIEYKLKEVDEKAIGKEGTSIGLLGGLGRLNAGLQTVAAFVNNQFVQSFLDANQKIQSIDLGFKAVYPDNAFEANRQFETLKQGATDLGFDLASAGKNFLGLNAAAKGTVVEGRGVDRIFQGVTTASARLGLSGDATSRMFKALEQTISKGKFSLEEIRQQFGDALPGAMGIFAESAGMSTADFIEAVTAGEIGIESLNNLGDTLLRKYGDNNGIGKTLSQSLGSVKNELDILAYEIGQSGVNTAIQTLVDDAASKLSGLSDAVRGVRGFFQDLADDIKNRNWEEVWKDFVTASDNALAKLTNLPGAQGLLAKGIKSAVDYFFPGTPSAPGEFEGINNAADPNVIRDLRVIDNAIIAAEKTTNRTGSQITDAIKDTNKDIKLLGSKDVIVDYGQLGEAIRRLSNSPDITEGQFLSAFNIGLRQAVNDAEALDNFRKSIYSALGNRLISPEAASASLTALDMAASGELQKIFETQDTFKPSKSDITPSKEKAANEALKLQQSQEKLDLERDKLKSNERIKGIEVFGKVSVARIDADAKITTSTFDSINSARQSESGLIGQVLSSISNFGGVGDDIKKQYIADSNKRLDEIHNIQKQLITAQLEFWKKKASGSGDALIKVNGDGLAPHLEAIMWEIFNQIQIRMAWEGGDALIGSTT